ncbi:MAG: alpha-glucan family phosphorylase [Deltaproteobacteria bacterium]|nr:alpha-glucan family phosphorylase [Deltaproteobacteria bacterium]
MKKPVKTIDVKPKIPEALKALLVLSENLWFVWNYDAADLFQRMNPDLWEETRENPVEFLGRLRQTEMEALAKDEGFLAHLERVKREIDRYTSERPNHDIYGDANREFTAVYLTAECGIARCLSIYSGGLGVLSGDHLKSASDLNLPIIGLSLAYQKGYFRQYLTQDGWQMETYPKNNFTVLPMSVIRDAEGKPIRVSLDLKGEEVQIQAWRVNIGRTTLYLLDTNVGDNSETARTITSELYSGDRETRIRQEIVLGMGGVRMLKRLGLDPSVYHMNEGHSAFTIFERVRQLQIDQGLGFEEALEFVRATSIFTTHTPVPEGNETFHPDLMRSYFEPVANSLGINFNILMGFGRQDPRNKDEAFNMTVLALRLSAFSNAVSRLHGKVSRTMWQNVWPNTPEIDIPVVHITNGVHIPSWISKEMGENYYRYLGPRWIEDPDNIKVWERIEKIPDTELWRSHEQCRTRLVSFTRKRLRDQMMKRGVPNRELVKADEVLNSQTLTIGFARRFAPYKRAQLILRDLARLTKIVTNEKFPVQIVFAGKAHPQNTEGKEIIKHLIQIASQEDLRRHVVFLEDYDIEMARYMVQGVDVWLNTPRRPLEACGTSGMKAVANGALHLSVLDGWWEEGYDRDIGWAIGGGEEYQEHEFQDDLESRALYDILEKDVVPLFYNRGPDGLPREWLAMVKSSLHRLCPVFNTHRMVEEYWERFYVPAAHQGFLMMENNWELVRSLASWGRQIMYNWGDVRVEATRMEEVSAIEVGKSYHVEADVYLGDLLPHDIVAEVYYGRLDSSDYFIERFTHVMNKTDSIGDHRYRYQCEIQFNDSGHFGLNIRITPNHPNPERRHAMGLVVWAHQ